MAGDVAASLGVMTAPGQDSREGSRSSAGGGMPREPSFALRSGEPELLPAASPSHSMPLGDSGAGDTVSSCWRLTMTRA